MSDRLSTHWESCWRTGGARHWQCAVAEAERQIVKLQAAEEKLALVDKYGHAQYENACAENQFDPMLPFQSFADWLAKQGEVQP